MDKDHKLTRILIVSGLLLVSAPVFPLFLYGTIGTIMQLATTITGFLLFFVVAYIYDKEAEAEKRETHE